MRILFENDNQIFTFEWQESVQSKSHKSRLFLIPVKCPRTYYKYVPELNRSNSIGIFSHSKKTEIIHGHSEFQAAQNWKLAHIFNGW